MATENHSWAYQPIQGELLKLGYRIGHPPSTGVLTARTSRPRRSGTRTPRGGDSCVPRPQPCSLRTSSCGLRGDPVAPVVPARDRGRLPQRPHPRGDCAPGWALDYQQVRNLLMDLGDRVTDFQFLVCDRAGQFTASFDAVLADADIEAVKIPPRSPLGERLRRAVRAHCPDRGHRPDVDVRPATPTAGPRPVRPARQPTTALSRPPAPPAPARPSRRRPRPGTDQAPDGTRRPYQRIRASRVDAQIKAHGRVLEPDRAVPLTSSLLKSLRSSRGSGTAVR
jgi:putative transposase